MMSAEEDAEESPKTTTLISDQADIAIVADYFNQCKNDTKNGSQFVGTSIMRRQMIRASRSSSNNSRRANGKKKAANGFEQKQQQQMARAGLIASLLLLAGICAVHLLIVADNPTSFIAKNDHGIGAHFGHSLRSNEHPFLPKGAKGVDQLVQSQLEKLDEDLTQFPANFGERQSTNGVQFRVNMLLTEQRRRNTVQRSRSATPIPIGANLHMATNRPQRTRPPNSMSSNSENWPPSQQEEPSTSDQPLMGMGEEPTLMDYDAIDAYWRWDIEQEKGPANMLLQQQSPYQYAYNNFQQFVEPQSQHQWPLNAQNDESAEMLLYERDIQLLTEKSQFPELSIFAQNDANANNLPINGLVSSSSLVEEEENDYLLTDISQSKWEIPAQWPTTSSRESAAQGHQKFGENNGIVGGNELLWTTERLNKLLPFQSTNNEDEGILLNIPIVTPPPADDYLDQHQPFVPPIGAEEEVHSSTCLFLPILPFIPSPSSMSINQPILFNDVSLAEAALNMDEHNDDPSNLGVHADQFPTTAYLSPNFLQSQSSPSAEADKPTGEEEDEMLLSTLFPQLFHQPIITNGQLNNNNGFQLPVLRSPSLSSVLSDGANGNLEVILRELATAELLLNASNMAAAQPLSPFQIPLSIQTPTFQHQQLSAAYSSPIGASIIPCINQQQQSPLLSTESLSPILEQLNQTQLMNVPSSSAGLSSLLTSPQDHDFYSIHQTRISARCSSTTSSGFGSSGPDTLTSTSPSFGFGALLHDDFSQQQNSPTADVFRYENKLVPKKAIKMENSKNGNYEGLKQSSASELMRPKAKGKRGRRSKDDSLVNQHGLPYSAEQLAAMPYREYATLMADGRLTGEQKAMIKKIRRRGRNKLAARKCRERRLNPREDGEEYDDEEEFDEEIDVGQPLQMTAVHYEGGSQIGLQQEEDSDISLDNYYEEEMKYEPAGIFHPSTSTASTSQQQMIPDKMRSGRMAANNIRSIQQGNTDQHQSNKAPTAIRVRV